MNRIAASVFFLASATIYHSIVMRASDNRIDLAVGVGFTAILFMLLIGIVLLFKGDSRNKGE